MCEERILEVPFVEMRVVSKQVLKPEIQFTDIRVPKFFIQYVENIVPLTQGIYEERGVHIPHIMNNEAINELERPHTEFIPKEFRKMVLPADCTVQVPSHQITPVEKAVLKIVPITREVAVEAPHVMSSLTFGFFSLFLVVACCVIVCFDSESKHSAPRMTEHAGRDDTRRLCDLREECLNCLGFVWQLGEMLSCPWTLAEPSFGLCRCRTCTHEMWVWAVSCVV